MGREREERIAAVAARQHGVFSFRQARDAGFPPSTIRHAVRSGRWSAVHPLTYRASGVTLDERGLTMAALLSVGEPAALCGTAAAVIWELEGATWTHPRIVVPSGRHLRRRDIGIVRTRRWTASDVVSRGPLRITSPGRTLLDVAPVQDRLTLELMLDDAHRRKLVSLRTLRAYVERQVARRVPGAATLRALLADRDPDGPNRSGGETKMMARLRHAGLPTPVVGHWIATRSGRRQLDFAYPARRLALELDSYRWHEGRARFDDDRVRDGELADAGWDRRYIPASMLDDPSPLFELTIASALGLRPTRFAPA